MLKVRLFKNMYGGMQQSISGKTKDGDKITFYMQYQFNPKKCETPNFNEQCDVEIIDMWFTCFKKGNGEIVPKIMVNEYKIISVDNIELSNNDIKTNNDKINDFNYDNIPNFDNKINGFENFGNEIIVDDNFLD